MANPDVGYVGNARDVIGQFKEGAWIAVPYAITIGFMGTLATGNATHTQKWACPFEEAYVSSVSISNSAAGTATTSLDILTGAVKLLDDDGNGTGATVDVSAALTTAKEYSVANDKIVTGSNANRLLRGEDLTIIVIGDSDSTTVGLLIVITLMVPIQTLDETTPGQNFKYA